MSKNKIIEETVETIIDNLEEKLVDYMFEYGDYNESDNKFNLTTTKVISNNNKIHYTLDDNQHNILLNNNIIINNKIFFNKIIKLLK